MDCVIEDINDDAEEVEEEIKKGNATANTMKEEHTSEYNNFSPRINIEKSHSKPKN